MFFFIFLKDKALTKQKILQVYIVQTMFGNNFNILVTKYKTYKYKVLLYETTEATLSIDTKDSIAWATQLTTAP